MKKILFLILVLGLLASPLSAATPDKPYADLTTGDTLTATWLMGTINTIYSWAQSQNASFTAHAADTTDPHGATLTQTTLVATTATIVNASASGKIQAAGGFVGALTGAVTGNVTGNLTGNATGNLTGNVTGNVSGTAANVTGTVAVANGGTGATTEATARSNLGLGTAAQYAAATAATGNTVCLRDASGYINASYIAITADTSTTCAYFLGRASGDTYTRWRSSADARSDLGANAYDVSGFIPGIIPSGSLIVFRHLACRAWTCSGTHRGSGTVNATAQMVFTVYKNGSSIGTITVGAGAAACSFSITPTAFAVGDVLHIAADADGDATLANVAFTLYGYY